MSTSHATSRKALPLNSGLGTTDRQRQFYLAQAKAAITTQEFYQDSKPAAIQEAIQQKAPQSPSESSVRAIKASPVLSEDAKLAATAGNNERTTSIADWRDITSSTIRLKMALTSAMFGIAIWSPPCSAWHVHTMVRCPRELSA
jgi:hypothetical protein